VVEARLVRWLPLAAKKADNYSGVGDELLRFWLIDRSSLNKFKTFAEKFKKICFSTLQQWYYVV
jgi:hypothetical protein